MHAHLNDRIGGIDALLAERLHLTGSLRDKIADARGRLPRVALAQARELIEAQDRLSNPATARALDPARVEATCAMLERHLHAVPEGKYRRRARSALIGLVAVRLLIVMVLFFALLVWRGFL
ncbi:hypothetical protein [Jannaschia sp. 2305UL9-9]|uniref:hypothetical protein n=1 Tax=Jannaschia sp. 2305UL9-9 TaxID=3121638 RepID=UPI003527F3A6